MNERLAALAATGVPVFVVVAVIIPVLGPGNGNAYGHAYGYGDGNADGRPQDSLVRMTTCWQEIGAGAPVSIRGMPHHGDSIYGRISVDMRRILWIGAALLLSSTGAYSMNLLEWLDTIAAPAVRSAPVLLDAPCSGPARVHEIERFEGTVPSTGGEFVYGFGELAEARGVTVVDPSSGSPYLVVFSTEVPRKVFLVQALSRGADGGLLVVRENPAVTPRLFEARVRGLDPGVLSTSSFRILDGQNRLGLRDLADPNRFAEFRSESNEYLSAPGSSGFPAQMALYHLQAARRRLGEMGIRVPSGLAPVYVNLAGMQHGFYRRASPFLLAFGAREASDADVLLHEYGHAVLDSINAPLLVEGESQFGAAIHEGFGDFLAFALTGNPTIGEWALSTPRNIQGTLRYPGGCIDGMLGRFDPYAASQVVSGIFYDIARKAGREATMRLLVDAAGRLPQSPNFGDLRAATIAAAKSTLPAMSDEIAAMFNTRGISADQARNEAADLSGESLNLRDGHGRAAREFDTRGQVEVVLEGQLHSNLPGYNLLGDLELSGPAGFDRSVVLVNGHWPAADGQVVAPIGHVLLRAAPAGDYQLRVRARIGGSARIYYLNTSFVVR